MMMPHARPAVLAGRRVVLRPLAPGDWDAWREVRTRCHDWLARWEPKAALGNPDPTQDRRAFVARCGARDREREMGTGFGFGVFVPGPAGDGGVFAGEINLNSIQRGPFQNAYIGYWMDQAMAGKGYIPESVVVLLRYAFEEVNLHRVQISVIPRNLPSRRVMEKLGLRDEGTAFRYLEIDGVWEDHVRYAITREEWDERRDGFLRDWVQVRD